MLMGGWALDAEGLVGAGAAAVEKGFFGAALLMGG